jgi:hypothetical protein
MMETYIVRTFSELKGSNEKICKDQGDADAFGPVLLGCDELCKGGNSSDRAQKTEDVDDCGLKGAERCGG